MVHRVNNNSQQKAKCSICVLHNLRNLRGRYHLGEFGFIKTSFSIVYHFSVNIRMKYLYWMTICVKQCRFGYSITFKWMIWIQVIIHFYYTQFYPYPKLNTTIQLYYCKTDVEGEVVEMCEVSLKSGS